MKITIRQEMVLLQPDKQENKTKSGIYLGDQEKKRSQTGTIIQVRPESSFKAGQRVFHSEFRGNEWKDEDGNLRVLLKESDILAIIEEW